MCFCVRLLLHQVGGCFNGLSCFLSGWWVWAFFGRFMGYNSKQLQPEQICPVFLAFLTQICTQITTSTIAHKIRVFSCLKTLGFPTGCFSCVSQRKNTRFPSFCCLACLSRIECFFCVKHSNFCRVFSVCFPRRKHVRVFSPLKHASFR